MSRTAVAILSTENLLHNLNVIKGQAPHSKVIAMVKANAYGHGLRSVSTRLEKHVDMLGVASIDEALALRKVGVQIPIILAEGVFEPNELLVASTEGFHVVFHEEIQLQWLANLSCPLPIHAWLKVDTGMGRLGFNIEHASRYFDQLSQSPQIARPIRIMSHLACADDPANSLNQQQIQAFQNFIQKIAAKGQSEFSLCNSAGAFQYPDSHYHYIRPGIALYGASPLLGKTAAQLNLKPVMTLQTSLIARKEVSKGSSIGYGSRFTCPTDLPVGIIAFGYGDGYPRTTRDGAPILVNNTKCKLIGRVSMDMIAVDLSPCPDAKVGDPVILWGNDLPIEEVAQFTDNVSYDLLTGVQNRVKFHWTRYANPTAHGTLENAG
ncbi:MAG: alanine racemase [Proteobacteria bacterium]|nr:alanine racemase [Pseudomonadota bacterium]